MPLYLGSNKIGSLYLGSTKIGQAYLGSSLVYSSSGGSQLPSGLQFLAIAGIPRATTAEEDAIMKDTLMNQSA